MISQTGYAAEVGMLTYDDTVIVKPDAAACFRPGAKGSVVGITPPEQRRGAHFEQFPEGIVYLVEFEDGEALDVHGSWLEIVRT
jgi:hypothetical protein